MEQSDEGLHYLPFCLDHLDRSIILLLNFSVQIFIKITAIFWVS